MVSSVSSTILKFVWIFSNCLIFNYFLIYYWRKTGFFALVDCAIVQAALGNGKSTKRSIVQCTIGSKNPIMLCSLLPINSESCMLDLEFEEEDVVIFSVVGPRSVHLTGYFSGHNNGDNMYPFSSFLIRSTCICS